ncbi:MAG: anti-sigma factor [Pyrinomonadaceae bacterium]
MKCRDLQFILPLYPDDVLGEAEQTAIAKHMDSCPVCRQKLADLQEIRNNFRAAPRPQLTPIALSALRRNVASRLEASSGRQMFQNIGDRRRWLDVWLMPFAVGSVSTLILGFTLLWVIIHNEVRPQAGRSETAGNTTILYPYSPPSVPVETELTPLEYASSRSAWSQESPSINPRGPLVTLTRDLLDEVEENEEVTVVADVYGNGSASIAQVVEPSSDSTAVVDLQRALESGPAAAAFVPASFDQRSEPMRVVLKIQSVSVNIELR